MKFSEMPYKRINVEEVKEQFKELMDKFKAAKSGEEQFEVHKEYYKLTSKIMTMFELVYIRHDMNTVDEFYDEEKKFFNENMPLIDELQVEYQKALYESPYREYLESKIGKVAFKNMELQIKSFKPEIIPLIQEDNKLSSEYSKLLSLIEVEWEGEKYNMSQMAKFTTSEDRATRKKASDAVTNAMMAEHEKLDEIYDKLVKIRTEQARKLGYDTFTEIGYARLRRNDYGPDEVAAYREEVKRCIVPLATKLHEMRRQRIGVDKLYYYDSINFKNGNPVPFGTPEEILEAGRKMYEELSPETGKFINQMLDNEMFDVFGRKNKRSGGYMIGIDDYNAQFVFANFNQTAHDVEVMTHECGHAFQGYLACTDEIKEHADITMETAEIHSMSMEFFTEGWMDKFFGDRADEYRMMHLEGAVTFIPYGCMVDEFQYRVYENPDMTPEERRQLWKELEKEYRPHMDYGDNEFYLSGALWQRQHHIYARPFYYIDYCLAQTVALQYKAWMDEDFKAAWESYLKLCKLSASEFFSKMLPMVGMKVPFEKGCLEETVARLEKKLGI